MEIFLIILHILVCFFLIFIVLLQSGKGAQMGASFGGASQTLFGARGAPTFLGKLTTGSAIIFMFTSLLLAVFSGDTPSLVPETPVEEKAPTAPMQQAPADQKEGTPAVPPPAETQEGVLEITPEQQQIPETSTNTPTTEKEAEQVKPPSDAVEEKQKAAPVEPEKNP